MNLREARERALFRSLGDGGNETVGPWGDIHGIPHVIHEVVGDEGGCAVLPLADILPGGRLADRWEQEGWRPFRWIDVEYVEAVAFGGDGEGGVELANVLRTNVGEKVPRDLQSFIVRALAAGHTVEIRRHRLKQIHPEGE